VVLGIWAIETADAFPGSQVLGNDLSPVQPTWFGFFLSCHLPASRVPPADRICDAWAGYRLTVPPLHLPLGLVLIKESGTFEVDDFTRPWLHPRNSFDFVNARALFGCVADWPALLHEAYNSLAPGGWFESTECGTSFFTDATPSGVLPENHIIRQWCELVVEGGRRSGKILDLAGKMGTMLKRAGFVNVEEKVFKVPHGPWPKDRKMKMVGKYNLVHLLEGCGRFPPRFLLVFGETAGNVLTIDDQRGSRWRSLLGTWAGTPRGPRNL
jgi:hypothetical protein